MTMDTSLVALVYVATSLYVVIAVVFADLTLREGSQKQLPWNAARVFGVFASVVWPTILLMALYEVRAARNQRS